MPRHPTDAARVSFPPRPPSEQSTVQSSLDLLHNWRSGSAATAIVMAVLLPFAVVRHANDLVAIATSVIVAATIAVACHVARAHRLATLAIFPQFAGLPELARTRRRLLRPRNRRRLVGWLRRTAAITQPPIRLIAARCSPTASRRSAPSCLSSPTRSSTALTSTRRASRCSTNSSPTAAAAHFKTRMSTPRSYTPGLPACAPESPHRQPMTHITIRTWIHPTTTLASKRMR